MKKQLLLIISIGFLAGLQSCANTSTDYYENFTMADKLNVGEMRTQLKGDLILFSLSLRNKRNESTAFQYKFKFLDQNGFEVQSESRPWLRKILSAKESTTLQALSPDATVISSKVHIKK